MLDGMIQDGLWDVYNDFHMGMTGELVAEKYEVDRAAQDEYAERAAPPLMARRQSDLSSSAPAAAAPSEPTEQKGAA